MSGSSDITSKARSFLQRRVARFGLIGLVFGVAGALAEVSVSPYAALDGWYPVLMFANVTPMLVLWLLCRTGVRSVRFVHAAEIICLMAFATSYALTARYGIALMLVGVPPDVRLTGLAGEMLGNVATVVDTYLMTALAFATSLVLTLRAAIVPSRRRRTFVLTLATGFPVLVATALDPIRTDPFLAAGSSIDRVITTVSVGMWWLFMTAVCTVISGVIFGLRREVRKAQRLGQYELESKLGEGGMGVVYRACHAMMRRPTALKLLPPAKAGEENLERFEREVQQTARLTHPNTITIYDYGRTPDGIFYYTMELLDGITVRRVVEIDGAQPAARVAHVLAGAAGALEEAHGIGLIHRDIKPANLMLCHQGGHADVPKLLDFGLVKQLAGAEGAQLTRDQSFHGTPAYMAPEAISDPGSVSPRTDLYALGAVGYYLLTGEHVFTGATTAAILAHHLHTEPQPPADRLGSSVPDDLSSLLLACLAKDPGARPSSMSEFLERLDRCECAGDWTPARARAWWEEHGDSLATAEQPLETMGTATIAADVTRGRDD